MATLPRRERPRTMYATIHRSPTDTPFLYLKPVVYSLTDGTSIPAPNDLDFDDENSTTSNPTSPTKSISKYSCFPSPSTYTHSSLLIGGGTTAAQPPRIGGPLSSHPVSPCTSPSSGTSPTSFSVGSSTPSICLEEGNLHHDNNNDNDDDDANSLTSRNSRRNTWRSDKATIGNPRASTMYNWVPPASIHSTDEGVEGEDADMGVGGQRERHPQRPRFVQRFLRLRSTGNTNSSGKSKTTKSEKQGGPLIGPQAYSFEGDSLLKKEPSAHEIRSMKRATSYSANLGLNLQGDTLLDTNHADDGYKRKTYASATFPRAAIPRRKKSFDILSTMKRVSGSWWNHDDDDDLGSPASPAEIWDRRATAEEEQSQRDSSRRGMGHGREGGYADDDDDAKTVLLMVDNGEPAPELPELETIGVEMDGGRIGGVELFEGIGR